MTTRTSQPAGGALLISEMKEFASFSEGDAALHPPFARHRLRPHRPDRHLGPRRSRSRLDPRPGPLLQAARASSPAGPRRQRPRHDRAVPGHAGDRRRLRPRPGPPADLRRLPLPLRAAARRQRPAVAAGRVLRRRRPAASAPGSPPDLAAVDQRERRDGAGLVEPRADLLARVGREGRHRRRRLIRLAGTTTDG